jgi:hypothetical protein
MVFGRKHRDDDREAAPADGVRATALVTETDKPLDNLGGRLVRSMQGAAATTRILVEVDGRPIVAVRDLWLDQDHWLTTGMQVPVIVDPAQPDDFAVVWADVPAIAQRAAANELSLVDPLGAKIRVWDALAAHGYTTSIMRQVAPSVAEVTARGMKAELDAAPPRFAEQMASAAQQSAPAGSRRALVLIATTTATLESTRTGAGADFPHRNSHGRHSVVLSVNVPGQMPYAVFVERFDHKHRAADPNRPGLPALVAMTDPTDVKVLWDELQKPREQRRDGRAAAREANASGAERVAAIQQQIAAATTGQGPSMQGLGAAFSPPPAVAANPAVKAAMEQSAKFALSQVSDPATRRILLDRYKSLGLEIDETE